LGSGLFQLGSCSHFTKRRTIGSDQAACKRLSSKSSRERAGQSRGRVPRSQQGQNEERMTETASSSNSIPANRPTPGLKSRKLLISIIVGGLMLASLPFIFL